METTIVYMIGIVILGFRVRILKCRPATPKVWHGDAAISINTVAVCGDYCRCLQCIEDIYLNIGVISLMSSSP